MRGLLVILLLLTAAKLGTQQYIVSTAKSEAIIAAYQARAVAACDHAAKANHYDLDTAWNKAGDVRLVIGKGSLDVPFWQVDNALWRARYKNPYLLLSVPARQHNVYCEFDVVQGSASLYRL